MMKSLHKQDIDFVEVEKNLTKSIFYLEKETGHFIDENYPYMKFLIEIEELNEYYEEQRRQQEGL